MYKYIAIVNFIRTCKKKKPCAILLHVWDVELMIQT